MLRTLAYPSFLLYVVTCSAYGAAVGDLYIASGTNCPVKEISLIKPWDHVPDAPFLVQLNYGPNVNDTAVAQPLEKCGSASCFQASFSQGGDGWTDVTTLVFLTDASKRLTELTAVSTHHGWDLSGQRTSFETGRYQCKLALKP